MNIGWVCANCKTSNTPGWRAGETPDQKLCNGKFTIKDNILELAI